MRIFNLKFKTQSLDCKEECNKTNNLKRYLVEKFTSIFLL